MTMKPRTSIKDWTTRAKPRETKAARRWWYEGGHRFKDTSASRMQYPEQVSNLKAWWVDSDPSPPTGEIRKDKGNKMPNGIGGGDTPSRSKKREEDACARSSSNFRKAKKIVKFLRTDQALKVVGFGTRQARQLPVTIRCGSLRTVVRSMYAPGLSPVQELSIKTSAKVEGTPCNFCRDLAEKEHLMAYQKARLCSQSVDPRHLDQFARAFAHNVPDGWNKRKTPYIPNGHGTKEWRRSEGGNWNDECFSSSARVELVYSAGKPRVVTMYSSYNVGVLTPLHHSLYSFLKGRNWLLVGCPTSERLRYLRDGSRGDKWLSFDYESATDNIKTAYVQRAVEILITKGEGLSVEEVDCLRVVGNLVLDGVAAESGQPMGSPMSFPLLCLINKTVVDLALTDLLSKGEISIEEYAVHRCLINGDDLLTRSTSRGDLVASVRKHGSFVGLRVNESKTMSSCSWAEINSTSFEEVEGEILLRKKTNVSALWMGAEVRDVIGYALEATTTGRGFGRCVAANASRLARQKIKTVGYVPPFAKAVLLRKPLFRSCLTSGPSSDVPDPVNLLETVPEPVGFSLSREEVYEVVTGEVTRLKQSRRWVPLFSQRKLAARARKAVETVEGERADRKTALKVLQQKRPREEKRVISILASFWKDKRKKELLAEEGGPALWSSDVVVFDGESCSPFTQILSHLKTQRNTRESRLPLGVPDPFSDGDGVIRFCDP